MRRFIPTPFRDDPGPCIICGEPHQACTPESVARQPAATAPTPTPPEPPQTINVKTYKRQPRKAVRS
jgi:hypothetical protein